MPAKPNSWHFCHHRTKCRVVLCTMHKDDCWPDYRWEESCLPMQYIGYEHCLTADKQGGGNFLRTYSFLLWCVQYTYMRVYRHGQTDAIAPIQFGYFYYFPSTLERANLNNKNIPLHMFIFKTVLKNYCPVCMAYRSVWIKSISIFHIENSVE